MSFSYWQFYYNEMVIYAMECRKEIENLHRQLHNVRAFSGRHLYFRYTTDNAQNYLVCLCSFTLIIRCPLCRCIPVSRMKFVFSIEIEIWTINCRKLKWLHIDVTIHWIFHVIKIQIYQGQTYATYRISIWLDIRDPDKGN